jgi:hypothetical protein
MVVRCAWRAMPVLGAEAATRRRTHRDAFPLCKSGVRLFDSWEHLVTMVREMDMCEVRCAACSSCCCAALLRT